MLTARTAEGQVVAGTVVQPDSITPLAGAIVMVTDALGTTIARVLTGPRGGFSVALPAPARYSLTLLRIGYRPTVGPTLTIAAGETARTRIVAGRTVVALAAMRARERETCRVSTDTGLMVARVWEEARKAMLSSQLSSDGAPLYAEWVEYDRALDPNGKLVRQQRVRSSQHLTQHAFKSVPADVLREEGYVSEDSAGVNYFAPDAEVLLSDAFVSGHCFRLVESEKNPDLVGVAFTPSGDRRDMREIEGTLWVDRPSSELRYVDFRYRNLPEPSSQAEPGGRVEFLRLAEGSWLVSRWHVRMPEVAKRDRVSQDGMRRTVMASTMLYLRAVRVSGGEVTRASRADTVLYRTTGPTVAVQLTSRDTLMRRAGAVLTLEGTDYSATADSSGKIRLSPVLAGRYRANVRTPLMEVLGMPTVELEVETHEDARVDSLALPSARDVLAHACPRESVANHEGMLHGQVRDEQARTIADAVVTTSWQAGFGAMAGRGVEYREKTLTSRSDAFGQWRVCGVPTGVQLSVTVATTDAADVQKVRLDDPYANVELVVHPRRLLSSDIASPGGTAVSLVEVAVTDEHGAPVPNVSVEARQDGVRTRNVVTGETGRVLLPDVQRSRLVVSTRRVGFAPGELTVDVQGARVMLPIRIAANSAPSLDTLRVFGLRTELSRNAEFDMRRRAHLATASISSEDIEQRNPTAIWQMLTNVPGVIVADRDNIVVARSQRAFVTTSNSPCFLQVMIDGVMMNKGSGSNSYSGFDLRELPPPEQIHGVEVFNGPASIPVQYGGEGAGKWCGLIAVWTK